MTEHIRLSRCNGIAIGPILFIIAALAILAAAIAAGSGSFTSGTSNENAKLMAQALIEQTDIIDNCVNVVRGNGFNDNQISFQVPAHMFLDSAGSDWGQTSSLAACTSDACKVYKTAGGGCTPQATPQEAVDQSVVDTSWVFGGTCPLGHNLGCRSPWFTLLQMQIEGGASAPLRLAYATNPAISKTVCMAINNIVGIQNPGSDAPHASINAASAGAFDASWYGAGHYFASSATFTANKDFCYFDGGGSMYVYVHIFR